MQSPPTTNRKRNYSCVDYICTENVLSNPFYNLQPTDADRKTFWKTVHSLNEYSSTASFQCYRTQQHFYKKVVESCNVTTPHSTTTIIYRITSKNSAQIN